MPLMSTYMAHAGLSDIMHILHTAGGACRTGTDIASRINTLNPDIDLDHEIHQLLSIETDLYNIYKTINTILQEQA